MNKILVLSCIFLVGACSAESENSTSDEVSSTLTIGLHGVQGSRGKVILAVYDEPDEFDKNGKSVIWLAVPARTRTITLDGGFEGRFAIAAFHDENENSDLDMNNNIPIEGYGNSGNVGKWDSPSFNHAFFEGGTANVKIYYVD
jgi:uncharacterized protein (DUF2141 family)